MREKRALSHARESRDLECAIAAVRGCYGVNGWPGERRLRDRETDDERRRRGRQRDRHRKAREREKKRDGRGAGTFKCHCVETHIRLLAREFVEIVGNIDASFLEISIAAAERTGLPIGSEHRKTDMRNRRGGCR